MKALFIDTETSGLVNHTAVSFGLIITDTQHFEILDELYLEILFDDKYTWSTEAEQIHGLSRAYLSRNGLSREDATVAMAEFIYEHFQSEKVLIGGHNCGIDIEMLLQFFNEFQIPLKLHHVVIDSSPLFLCLENLYASDKVFKIAGIDKRGKHDALDDAKASLQAVRYAREKYRG